LVKLFLVICIICDYISTSKSKRSEPRG